MTMEIRSLTNPGVTYTLSSVEDAASTRESELRQLGSQRATARYSTIELVLLTAVAAGVYDRPEVAALLSPQEAAAALMLKPAAEAEAVEAVRTALAFETAKAQLSVILSNDQMSDEDKLAAIDAVEL